MAAILSTTETILGKLSFEYLHDVCESGSDTQKGEYILGDSSPEIIGFQIVLRFLNRVRKDKKNIGIEHTYRPVASPRAVKGGQ